MLLGDELNHDLHNNTAQAARGRRNSRPKAGGTDYCAGTKVESCVCMSITDPYAVIRPSPSTTRTAMRMLYTLERPRSRRMADWRYSFGWSSNVTRGMTLESGVKTLTSMVTALPESSANATFVR